MWNKKTETHEGKKPKRDEKTRDKKRTAHERTAMLKKGFKQAYHITFVEVTNVPASEAPYVLEWKRGDKAQNKGMLTAVHEVDVCLLLG